MQLREDLQLETILRALREVILPAVDRHNALAVEQTQVVIGMLQLMAARLPLTFRYDCDELSRLLDLCRRLPPTDAPALAAAIAAGADVLARAQADPAEVLQAVRRLRATSGEVISAIYPQCDDTTRATLSRLVLGHAEAQLLRERAWLAPQGWEANAAALPPLEDLL